MTGATASVEEPLEHELDPQLQREIQQYPGQWVAMTRSELVAVGDSALAVYRAAVGQGVLEPVIYHVPTDGDTVYFF